MVLPKNGALAGATINIMTMALLVGFFGYQLIVLPEVIQKLDRGYEKIVQSQEIQNKTGQKQVKYFTLLFQKIANNTEQAVIAEHEIQHNLTHHRIIANISYDNMYNQHAAIKKMLNDYFNITR